MAMYDIPAMIEFVRKTTGNEKVAYVGHSLGTIQMFTALSENTDSLQDKVSMMVGFAPLFRLDHTESDFLKAVSQDEEALGWVMSRLGVY